MSRGVPLLALVALAACSRGASEEAKRRVLGRDLAPAPAAGPPDLSDPRALLGLDADEAARRIGSFEWTGLALSTVSTQADSTARVQLTERHRVRQLSSGEFEAEAEIDTGQGPGSETSKHVVWVGGLTYARGGYSPWRERPTDRGRDARRFRDESFGLVAELARLYGPGLALTAAGDATVLGRPARRFTVALAKDAPAAPLPQDGRTFATNGPDEDSKRHLAFLDGRVPLAAKGEVLLDVQTGLPLSARIVGAFGVKDDPRVRVQVEVSGSLRALGDKVGAVKAPRNALPDQRKPPGVAAALEAAGLRVKETREKKGEAEPADEPEP